jgi:predicted GNAT family acetyltransferase
MNSTPDAAVEVADRPERERYEITVDGRLAGFAQYVIRGGRRYFVHTEIGDEYEGKGLGSRLARAALDLARADGMPVIPLCPFIAGYIDKHPEYDDLVDRALYDAMR